MCLRAGIILPAFYAAVLLLNASPSPASAASPPDSAAANSTSMLPSDIKLHFDLPAGPLDKALRDFAVQADRNISYEPTIVAGLQAPAIKGEFTVGDALTLLLKSTTLRAVNVNTKTIRILEKAGSAAGDDAKAHNNHYTGGTDVGTSPQMSAGSASPPGSSLQTVPENSSSKDTETQGTNDIDEITVTGTPMATSNSSACGHPKIPHLTRS
jgi:hypothetical protein